MRLCGYSTAGLGPGTGPGPAGGTGSGDSAGRGGRKAEGLPQVADGGPGGPAAAAAGAGVIKKQAEKSKAIDAALNEAETVCCKEALSHKL